MRRRSGETARDHGWRCQKRVKRPISLRQAVRQWSLRRPQDTELHREGPCARRRVSVQSLVQRKALNRNFTKLDYLEVIQMAIEWGTLGESTMSHRVTDTTGHQPQTVLKKDAPFDITVDWQVPSAINGMLAAPANRFRLRAYAESIGPGPEQQIGADQLVDANAADTNYRKTFTVPAGALLGEGELFDGVPVSGIYRIVVVLQLMNGAFETVHSGYSDVESTIFVRTPS
jgi:hypothetical protein